MIKAHSEPTYVVRIYLSGPIDVAAQVCRAFCARGLCVTIEPTRFIYTGGEETGYVVGLLNYPRFPKTNDEIMITALELAKELLIATYQGSALVVGPDWTTRLTQESTDT